MQYSLSCYLKDLLKHGKFKPYVCTNLNLDVTHLSFADDLLIFCNADLHSIKNIRKAIAVFEDCSGQKINGAKSPCILDSAINRTRADAIARATGFSLDTLLFKYLGASIFEGKPPLLLFDKLKARIQNKLQGWKARLLSSGGKIVLIKATLNSLVMHLLAVMKPPNKVIREIQSIIQHFFWDSDKNYNLVWISAKKMFQPTDKGGIGVESIQMIMKALHIQLAWNYIKSSSLWASILQNKYGKPQDIAHKPRKSICSQFGPQSIHCFMRSCFSVWRPPIVECLRFGSLLIRVS